jgi:antitoxin component of RelBE/YafQ-DinJ toxin-antitoxin module
MRTSEAIRLLLRHFAPEERNLPDDPNYPGRNAEAIHALNAAFQELAALSKAWRTKREAGRLLNQPTQVQIDTVKGSSMCTLATGEEWMDGCTVLLDGKPNRIAAATGVQSLVYPAMKTGTFSATVYHDSVKCAPDVVGVLAKIRLDDGTELTPVRDVESASRRILIDGDYGRYVFRNVGGVLVTGTPAFYAVESLRDVTKTGEAGVESQSYFIRLSPAPSGKEMALRWRETTTIHTVLGIESDELPTTPAGFVESILIPIAEYHLMSSSSFRDVHLSDQLQTAYARALDQARRMTPGKASGMTIHAQF